MNTKSVCFLLSLLSVVDCLLRTAPLHAASGPVVSGVSFLQDVVVNPGPRRVIVTYTLAHPNSLPCTVFLEADRDGTGIYEQLTAVSGAVGEGLDTSPGGLVKTAVWDVGASPGWAKVLYPTVRLRVTATTSAATTSRNFFVTVGDVGNTADPTTGYGAVAYAFQIQKFEFTNAEYVEFLNAVGGTNPNGIYSSSMGSDPRGGIAQSGTSPNFTYAAKANMGDKPVNFVSWFEAARVANWLHNGRSTDPALLETGAYTLNNATSGVGFTKNAGARFWVPSEDEWYKAAYYKGGGMAAGYWVYPTRSDTEPTYVTASSTGVGSAGLGSTANSINGARVADWNGQDGNLTTVGSNGGPSSYGSYDLGGNVWEWDDGIVSGSNRAFRGDSWSNVAINARSGGRSSYNPATRDSDLGFRLSRISVP